MDDGGAVVAAVVERSEGEDKPVDVGRCDSDGYTGKGVIEGVGRKLDESRCGVAVEVNDLRGSFGGLRMCVRSGAAKHGEDSGEGVILVGGGAKGDVQDRSAVDY
jgi:hypothetical protein